MTGAVFLLGGVTFIMSLFYLVHLGTIQEPVFFVSGHCTSIHQSGCFTNLLGHLRMFLPPQPRNHDDIDIRMHTWKARARRSGVQIQSTVDASRSLMPQFQSSWPFYSSRQRSLGSRDQEVVLSSCIFQAPVIDACCKRIVPCRVWPQ